MSELPSAPAHHAPTRRLAAWKPAGLSEWPGRVSTTLFLSGCSLGCAACASDGLRAPTSEPLQWDRIIDHIEERRSWLDGVVVAGGEPTEDPDLPSLLAAICDLGLPVSLRTNGARPDVLGLLLAEQLVEHVSLSVKTTPARYSAVCGSTRAAAAVAASVELVIRSRVEHEFRTVAHPGSVGLDELPRIARSLRGGQLYVIEQYRSASSPAEASGGLRPYEESMLRAAATACSLHLPTIVRGLQARVTD